MRCPYCGKELETQQRKAAASRWAGMTPAQRSAEMSRIRRKGAAKKRPRAKGQNETGEAQRPDGDASNATRNP
jgi:hypothetical protein